METKRLYRIDAFAKVVLIEKIIKVEVRIISQEEEDPRGEEFVV